MSALARPSTAIVRETPTAQADRTPRDDQEALELHQIQTREDDELEYSSASASSGDEYRITPYQTTSRAATERSHRISWAPWRRLCRFWTHNVTLTVPQKSNRDHLGRWKRAAQIEPGIDR